MSEQMYLKCVSGQTGEDATYREGTVYKVLGSDSQGCYRLEAESGDKLYVPLNGGVWKFEVVGEQPKLTPRSLGCFQEVADVIGESAAEVELKKVLDSSKVVWIEGAHAKDLVSTFEWGTSPQDHDFWDSIDDGNVPEELQTKEQPKVSPVFGDVLHYNGEQVVYLNNLHSGCHLVSFENGVVLELTLEELDEYKPNETQELRNRILERWKRKSLDNSHDTEVCIAEMRVSDLIDFVVDNLNAEYSGE